MQSKVGDLKRPTGTALAAGLDGLDTELWVISIDLADKLEAMREKMNLDVVNLMDPGSETIKRYGILNETQGQIPHPTTLVIDLHRGDRLRSTKTGDGAEGIMVSRHGMAYSAHRVRTHN